MRFLRVTAFLFMLVQASSTKGQTNCSANCPSDPAGFDTGGPVATTTLPTFSINGPMSWFGTGSSHVSAFKDFTVVAGRTYEWSMCDADGGVYSTGNEMALLNPATSAPLCNWLLTSACGEPKIRYLAPANGLVRISVTRGDCGADIPAGRVNWRCVNCFGANGSNGCTNAPNGEFPIGTFTPSCSGKPEVITSNAADGTYSTVQLTAGVPTTFSAAPNPLVYPTTVWITITNGTGTTIYGYWPNSRTFNPPSTGTYRFYTHYEQVDMGCGTFFGDARTVRCGIYDPCTTTPIACEAEQIAYMQGTGSWTNAGCGATAGIERIYTFAPGVSGTHQLQVTSATYPSPGIRYSWKPASLGCDANNWNCLGTAANLNTYSFNLTAGVPIYILAQAVASDAMWQKFVLHCTVPQNQSCATAEPVGSYPTTINADAQLASSALSASCFSAANRTLWYKATGVCGGMTANTCGTAANTVLAVYSGSCGSLTELACSDNATSGSCSGTQQSQVSWASQSGTDYYIAVASAFGSLLTNVVLNVSTSIIDGDGDGISDACEARPNVRALLDGPYDGNTGLMNDGIRLSGFLPLTEPYTAIGYPHVNGGGESTTAPVLSSTGGNNAIVDWVMIELRSATTPSLVVDTRSALLQRDGDVVDVDGVSPVNMRSPSGNYHVAVRHRNHLGVMTAAPIALSTTSSLLDLSNTGTTTYGTNARKTSGGAFSKQVLWSGDVDRDGTLKYTGAGNDRDPILAAIGGVVPTNMVSGYSLADVNLDGVVKYTGVGNDRDFILSNIGGTVPTNTRVQQLP